MSNDFSYHDYVKNETFHDKYIEYQQKYRDKIRESDKVILETIGSLLDGPFKGRKVSCLDIGCSTGNLLFHLRHTFPGMELMGGDFAESQIESCRADKALEGIHFQLMDMLNIGLENKFDFIIANAVAVYFEYDQYEQAARSVFNALKDGGYFIAFEWIHPFEQDLKIVETSKSHPDGLKIFFRPRIMVKNTLEKCGFSKDIIFKQFEIPIDLSKGDIYKDGESGFEDLNSYTVKTETGDRLLFRGALYQPWCHVMAHKAAASGGGK